METPGDIIRHTQEGQDHPMVPRTDCLAYQPSKKVRFGGTNHQKVPQKMHAIASVVYPSWSYGYTKSGSILTVGIRHVDPFESPFLAGLLTIVNQLINHHEPFIKHY